MAKIQISTVKQTADVEVINVNAYLVAKVVRAHMIADTLVDRGKSIKRDYDKESKTWVDVMDENGKPVYTYADCSVQTIEKHLLPLLEELVEAFGVKDTRVL